MRSSDQTPKDPSQTSSAASSSCTNCRKRRVTSPIAPAASSSKKPKTDDNSLTIEIDKFLECSVCLDFPASPIHSCANAHVLCGQCAPKFRACPTCQLPKLSPSPIAEKLAKEANMKIECGNLEAGCKGGVLSTKFVHHLPLCYYREITCNYEGDCGLKVKFNEYTKHLEEAHNEEILIGPKIPESYLYNEKKHAKSGDVLFQWGHTVSKFESHEFIVHAQVSKKSQLFFSWVCILGDKDLAAKYSCKVKFKSLNEFRCSWKLPVLPFHEIPSNVSEAKLFEYSGGSAVAAVPLLALRNWGVLEENQVLPIDVTYEIKDA